MRVMQIILILLAILGGCLDDTEYVIIPDEAGFNRQRCFDGQHELCECDNPGTDAEARYCEENDL